METDNGEIDPSLETGEVEQPLQADEIILGADGLPITRPKAWEIALQKAEGGKVITDDGEKIWRSKALRMAMDKDFELLASQLEAGFTEPTIQYLTFASRMHRYSPANQDFLWMQDPSATMIQSFTAWSRAGYKLKSNEEGCRALWVLQPRPYAKVTTKDKDGEEVDVKKLSVYFRAVPVYDVKSIDQTYKAVPNFFRELEGNAISLIVRLTQIVEEDGIKIVYDYPISQGAMGESGIGIIRIRPDLGSIRTFSILAHEVMHEKLHSIKERQQLSKLQRESQAEIGSFLLSSHFGITNNISSDYLKLYGATKDTLKANLAVTQPIVHQLIERMEEGYNETLKAEFEYKPEQDGERKQYVRKGKSHKRRS